MPAMRVLLAEDDETKAVQTQSMLREAEDADVTVDWVSSAAETLRHIARGGYDAYLVDVTLGKSSGLDVLARAIEGGCQAPIVLLAEHGEGEHDTEALRLGAADFLVKGETTAPQLRRAVTHAIERARVARALRESQARLLQAERTESLGRLAGGIAHDFNNLLTGILSCTATLEEQIAPEHPAREPIDAVRRTAELAARLARQLLAYGGRQTIEPSELDLNRVVEGLAEMLKRLVGDHLTFGVQTAKPLPLVVADRSQMEQVVMNLVLNARDATPPGGRITIRTGTRVVTTREAERERLDHGGEYVWVSVEDTGRGMSRDVLARAFEPFFTTKPKGSGTGLGLATAYGTIAQSGGFMQATSELGVGTTMTALLPRSASLMLSPPMPAAEAVPGASGPERVLVVEDEPAVRRYVTDALTRFGYQTVVAETPTEALELVAQATPMFNLLLTDVVLPEMSGMHLAQRATKMRPGLRVVFMSGHLDPRVGHAALPAGAMLLRKPFPPDELARVVRRGLDAA
jgi:two-component system, cell cycle sensor histidine kinase and response regulator CckA